MGQKIKSFTGEISKSDIWTIIILILVAITCFELGRISKSTENSSPLVILGSNLENNPNTSNFGSTAKNIVADVQKTYSSETSGDIMASKNGTKYYFSNCSGVSRISTKNLIYFKTEAEAISAGYEKSSTCK